MQRGVVRVITSKSLKSFQILPILILKNAVYTGGPSFLKNQKKTAIQFYLNGDLLAKMYEN
jgi:hypothetical protein